MKIIIILLSLSLTLNAQTFKSYKDYNKFEVVTNCYVLAGVATAYYGFKTDNAMIITSGIIFTALTVDWHCRVKGRNLRITYEPKQIGLYVGIGCKNIRPKICNYKKKNYI